MVDRVTVARRRIGPRVVGRCAHCGKSVYRGQPFYAWDEEGRTMRAHSTCHRPGNYRSPTERGIKGNSVPMFDEGSK